MYTYIEDADDKIFTNKRKVADKGAGWRGWIKQGMYRWKDESLEYSETPQTYDPIVYLQINDKWTKQMKMGIDQ